MKQFTKISQIREYIRKKKKENNSIGFVPTMGYLHEGHLSLVRLSLEHTNITIVSIFINPTQFGENEDYDSYPVDIERDCNLLEKEGVDAVFTPSVEEIYPEGFEFEISPGKSAQILCGRYRPGHFNGVCTIVAKLFNIITPDKAFFGKKDAQQFLILKKMVRDLNFDIQLIGGETVREKDGLAVSSRNEYLSPKQREHSLLINKALEKAKQLIKEGEKDTELLKETIYKTLTQSEILDVQYVEAIDINTFNTPEKIDENTLFAVAVFAGKARLIDNFFVNDII